MKKKNKKYKLKIKDIMTEKYFTAEEAKVRSTTINNNKLDQEIDFIYEKIQNAVEQGESNVVLYNKKISKEAKKFLFNKGFKVSWWGGSQRDPCNDTKISWE